MAQIAAHNYLKGVSTAEVKGKKKERVEKDTTLNNRLELRKEAEINVRESFQGMSSVTVQKRLSKEIVESP